MAADFPVVTPNPVATGAIVTFDPVGSDPEGGTLSMDFGDGSPVELFVGLTPLTHTYVVAGTYNVTLTCNPAVGLGSSASLDVYVVDDLQNIPIIGECTLTQGYLMQAPDNAPAWTFENSLPGIYEGLWTAAPVSGGIRFTVESTFFADLPADIILWTGVSISNDGDINGLPPTDFSDPFCIDFSIDASSGVTLTPNPYVWPVGTVVLYDVAGGQIPNGSSYTASFTIPAIYATSLAFHFPFLFDLDPEDPAPSFYDEYVGLAWIANDCAPCPPGSVPIPAGTLVDDPVTIIGPSGESVILQMIGNASDISNPQGTGFIADGALYPAQAAPTGPGGL